MQQGRKTLGCKSNHAEIKRLNVTSPGLPEVDFHGVSWAAGPRGHLQKTGGGGIPSAQKKTTQPPNYPMASKSAAFTSTAIER
jgi:hypothetical protein